MYKLIDNNKTSKCTLCCLMLNQNALVLTKKCSRNHCSYSMSLKLALLTLLKRENHSVIFTKNNFCKSLSVKVDY